MSKRNSQPNSMIAVSVIILGLAFSIGILAKRPNQSSRRQLPVTISSPTIPESSASAKEYIDRASAAAVHQDFDQAIKILKLGIEKFPDDVNLKLTLEYYENEAQRNQ